MQIRPIAVAVVLAWFSALCWATPWNPVYWPQTYRTIVVVVFSVLVIFGCWSKTRALATDIALLTFTCTALASIAWNLWMMHGWFSWEWVQWLASATQSDGEGAYLMVEYQFFILIFIGLLPLMLVIRKKLAPNAL